MLPATILRAALPLRSSSTVPSISITATSLPYAPRTNFSTTSSRPDNHPNWLKNVYQRRQTPHQTIRQDEQSAAIIKPNPSRLKTGTVVSVGRMDKTVTVHERAQEWDKHIRKFYPKINKLLVSDPRNSLREGDVIEFSSGSRKSRRVSHVVEKIVAPFGSDIADRPPVMTPAEREAERAEKKARKDERRLEKARELLGAGEGGEERLREFEALWNAEAGTVRIGRIKALVNHRLALAGERKKATVDGGEVLP